MSAAPTKKTVYVDVDEEITGVIDKVRSSSASIIALVLPKRAAVFHSIVNMKLLKRVADQNKKKVVLITSEATLMPLAGNVGIHVAQSLQSKPFIPSAPSAEAADIPSEPIEVSPDTTVGEVAGPAAFAAEADDAIEIDNRPKDEDLAAAGAAAAATKAAKPKKSNKLKVPNFQKFRMLLILGGLAVVLLIAGLVWAFTIAPKATITLRGETSDVALNFDMVANTDEYTLNEESGIIPARQEELKKTDTEKVPATGQKDNGNKASGTMTLKNCSKSDGGVTIPAGTGVSSGEFTFITQAAVTLDPSEFSGGGTCKSDSKQVAVVAQQAGDKYNLSARSYTVTGANGVIANGSIMTGGTSQIVKVVSQGDVDSAKQKLIAKQAAATEELKNSLKNKGYVGIIDTFVANPPAFKTIPDVNAEGSEVTVTADTTYSMLAVKQDDLKKLVKAETGKKIDISKQSILSDGLSDAIFKVISKKGTRTTIDVQTKVVAGPDVNQDEIKQTVAGKKRGEAEQILSQRPGIKEARVETKPFWNKKVPKKPSKVTITVQQADGSDINP